MLVAAIALASAMNAAAKSVVDGGKTPGVQYAVVSNGTIAASGFAGRADVAANVPVTGNTRFRIGSVTKLFTAVAVMQLVERGSLSLDDTLAQFQPSFPSASSITIRDLLMHRSGIADYADKAIATGAAQTPTTPQAIVASMATKPLLSPPGTAFSYSNTNYVLLGLVVERLSGTSLHAYYRTNIFAPAHMTQTFAGAPPSGVPVASGYARDIDGTFSSVDPGDVSWYYACGDVWSTADDLARFDVALMTGKLLEPATLHSMIAAAKAPSFGPDIGYGLGVTTVSSAGSEPFVGHHGGLPGFAADDEMLLSERFAVISLGNSMLYPTSTMTNAAFQTLYPERMRVLNAQIVARAREQAAQAPPENPELTQRFTAFFASMLSGTVNTSGLSPEMVAALTPAVTRQLGQGFAKNGKFIRLRYGSQDMTEGYHRYHYVAIFTGGSQPVTFVLDGKGDIGGFLLL